MKLIKMVILVLPAYVLLSACGPSRPDAGKVSRNMAAAAAAKSVAEAQSKTPGSSSAAPASVADLQKKQEDLQVQKAELVAQQQAMQGQQASFALPANVQGQAFGDFMANAQALPAAVDQAKVDKVIQAAQAMDLDALQKAVADLVADLQDLIADLQAQIDDLAAQIAAAQT